MAMNIIGKVLSSITMLWGVFLLLVFWTGYFEMDLFDEEILYMACRNSISFTAITIGFFVFQIRTDNAVVIQSN